MKISFARLVCGLLAVVPVTVHAQDEHTLSSACSNCRVTVQRQVLVGENGGLLGSFRSGAIAADGRYAVVVTETPHEVQVFSPRGTYEHSVFRKGDGPGEAQFIWHVEVAGDTVYAYHREGRISVAHLDGTVIRSFRAPFALDVARLGHHRTVLNSDIRTSEREGLPLHAIEDDSLVRSFGSPSGEFRAEIPWASWRSITKGSSNSIWAAAPTSYTLEEWSWDGTLLRSMHRDTPWFQAHTDRPTFQPDNPPPPRLNDLHSDAEGRLWVLLSVADPDWRDGLVLMRDHPDGPRHVPGDINRYFDTIIEVIDPATASVIASGRMDAYAESFIGEGRIVSTHTLDDGTPVLQVWSLGLTTPSGRRQ